MLRWVAPLLLVIALGIAAFLIRTVPTIPGILVAYGRYAATWMGQQGDIFYVGEGLSSSVAVSRFGDVMNYHNAGKVQASSQPQDMRLQRMLGHFTTLVPKSPKKVLVIGCGAGATAGAVSIDRSSRRSSSRKSSRSFRASSPSISASTISTSSGTPRRRWSLTTRGIFC